MSFDYDFSTKLKSIIEKLKRKSPKRVEMIRKKVMQIINSDEFSIEHFKNLKHDLKKEKRVHIDKSFVLAFSVDENKKLIIIEDYDHHDNIYK